MTAFTPLMQLTWALTAILEVVIFALLMRRKAIRVFPSFALYLCMDILQNLVLRVLYGLHGLEAWTVWKAAWGTQAVVTAMRFLALVELARQILGEYKGIWALAKRMLWGTGIVVMGIALLFSRGRFDWVVMNAVRGLEFVMAALIVIMLLFARYYRLSLRPFALAVAVGFCLYSTFYVINYSLLERAFQKQAEFWNFLRMMTFLASLLVWARAASRYSIPEKKGRKPAISPEAYGKLSSDVNLRLYLLNRQVNTLLNSEEHRP